MGKNVFYVLIVWLMCSASQAAEIAVLLDDMGNSKHQLHAFELPMSVGFAILPHTRFATAFAHKAHGQNREIFIHVPMEALSGKALGPGAITASMSPKRIQHSLAQAAISVPNAIGLNNHMGSKLTQLSQPMRATMAFLRARGMMFIDSRTTKYSKAARIAGLSGVEHLSRQVFLDHGSTNIHQQFAHLLTIAKRTGKGLAIAHPYPSTLAFLSEKLASLPTHQVTLVPVSQLLGGTRLVSAARTTLATGE